jgi:hypothetical protein
MRDREKNDLGHVAREVEGQSARDSLPARILDQTRIPGIASLRDFRALHFATREFSASWTIQANIASSHATLSVDLAFFDFPAFDQHDFPGLAASLSP